MENGRQNVYPITIEDNGKPSVTHLGLTKREYFSVMAMQGLLACPDIAASRKDIADEAVLQADELIIALESKSV